MTALSSLQYGLRLAIFSVAVFLALPGVPPAVSLPSGPISVNHLPAPTSYSAMGDSITTAYDANGTAATAGVQPYYSYATGWNTTVLSLAGRLDRLYGPGTVTTHLLAVPGDKASDMVWQARAAVANKSQFVTVLIGGNDACNHTGSFPNAVPTPTPTAAFSYFLNQSFSDLRSNLPNSTVISLGNVVNVSLLYNLFSGNAQAQTVYSQTCPGLLSSSGRATIEKAIRAYNEAEVSIVKNFNLIPWDIADFNFTSSDVNSLDYFHPSIFGHEEIAEMWWHALPYSKGLPRISVPPSYPPYVQTGTPLNVSFSADDVESLSASVTFEPSNGGPWVSHPLSLSSGTDHSGTFLGAIPASAVTVPGTLRLFVSATDLFGVVVTYPAGASPQSGNVTSIPVLLPMSSAVTFSRNPALPRQVVTVGDHVVNGIGGLNFTWTLNGTPIHQSSASLAYVPYGSGNYSFTAMVTDSLHRQVISTATLTVTQGNGSYTLPQITRFAVSPDPDLVGFPLTMVVNVTAGTAPYFFEYSGLPAGCVSQNRPALNCTPLSSGIFSPVVNVTDSHGFLASATHPITIQNLSGGVVITSFTATPFQPSIGYNTTFSVSVAAGVEPYSFIYLGLPPGCVSQDAPLISCAPNTAGNYMIMVTATDAKGSAAIAYLNLSVAPVSTPGGPEISSLFASPNPSSTGQLTTFTVGVLNGTSPNTIHWSGLPSGCSAKNSTSHTFSCVPVDPGNFTIRVSVTDGKGLSVASTTHLRVGGHSLVSPSAPSYSGWWSLDAEVPLLVLALGSAVLVVGHVYRKRKGHRLEPPRAIEETPAHGS